MSEKYTVGISVIVPSFAGRARLPRLIECLNQQSLDPRLFEVIVVLNGPDDSSAAYLRGLTTDYDLRIINTTGVGAAHARNVGLASVTREYLTFVDDDDALEPEFLATGFRLSKPQEAVLLPMRDIGEDGRHHDSALSARISQGAGRTQLARVIPWALGFNACKILPSHIATRYRFDEELKSGEDVAFFAQLLTIPHFAFTVPADAHDAAYLRSVRQGSVSRQKASFQFSVVERLQCIAKIRALRVDESSRPALKNLEDAQFTFVRDYLSGARDQVEDAIACAVDLGVAGLPWSDLRPQRSKKLVVSYCFPPFADPAANVMAKTLASDGVQVDVISADMRRIRKRDESTYLMVETVIGEHVQLRTECSFSAWPLIAQFGRDALRAARKLQKKGSEYSVLYTRALWSGSHVAGALIKLAYPQLRWEAEFSDPLRVGADGQPRWGKLTPGPTAWKLTRALKRLGGAELEIASHFDLTEAVTILLADKLLFTNENQRHVMLSQYPAPIRCTAEAKSVVRPQPTPPKHLYHGMSTYQTDGKKLNIGYFGSFYRDRGLGPILDATMDLPQHLQEKLEFHVFCDDPRTLRAFAASNAPAFGLRVNDYVPYLEFLAITHKLDVLLVNDMTLQPGSFTVNPFLPSKYSDYAGSGVPVWGIVTPGSPLSAQVLDFRSSVGDANSIRQALVDMMGKLR